MNFFEKELRRFTDESTAFKFDKVFYIGRAAFLPLAGGCTARLEFVSDLQNGYYTALQVTILSKHTGKLDTLRLDFDDFFGDEAEPSVFVNGFKMTGWRIDPTKEEILRITQAAYDYIGLFT